MASSSTPTTSSPSSSSPSWQEATHKRAREIFAQLDTNKDGKLSREELAEGLRLLRLPSGEVTVAALLESMDTDHDGAISPANECPNGVVQEFEEFAMKQRVALKQIFDELDSDNNGNIDILEVRASLTRLGMKFDEDELLKLMKRIDKNNNGQIDFDELQEFLYLVPVSSVEAVFRYWENAKALDLEDGIMLPPTKIPSSVIESVSYMAAGALAAMSSRTATAPMERIKTIYQIQTTKPSIRQIAGQIYKDSGIAGFWRGNGANIMKVAPEKAIKFLTYETVKGFFNSNDAEITGQQRFISGACAGVFTHTLSYPLEVIKTRLSAAPHGTYSGITDVVRKIIKTEGPVRPFFRGIAPSLLSTAPHSGIDLSVYEVLKRAIMDRNGGTKEPTVPELLACSTASSIVGLLTCYPLHVAKTRMVMQGIGGSKPEYSGMFDVLSKTFRREGILGLYRGIVPSIMKSVPSHGITYVSYELLKKEFGLTKKHKH